MDVLSSRVLLHPTDPERSRVYYRDTLGLAIYREFGRGPERGTVFFLGGGFLELSGRAAAPPAPGMALWLQVRELAAARRELGERGVRILREPKREPWGCWRCGSRTRTGCASASWRCRRSTRCAAAADTHLRFFCMSCRRASPQRRRRGGDGSRPAGRPGEARGPGPGSAASGHSDRPVQHPAAVVIAKLGDRQAFPLGPTSSRQGARRSMIVTAEPRTTVSRPRGWPWRWRGLGARAPRATGRRAARWARIGLWSGHGRGEAGYAAGAGGGCGCALDRP